VKPYIYIYIYIYTHTYTPYLWVPTHARTHTLERACVCVRARTNCAGVYGCSAL